MTGTRLLDLRKTIDRCDQAYYYADPFLDDAQYDALKDELRKLCPGDERLARVGAPVPKDTLLKRVKNQGFMGSLRKVDTREELTAWYEKSGAQSSGGAKILVQLKADGGSLALYYRHGNLIQALTRGGDDGVGEDITANAIHMAGVPTSLPQDTNVMIRGECVLMVKDWRAVDPEEKSNPRNVGNGIMRRLDGQNSEKLTFLAFDAEPLGTTLPDEVTSEAQKSKMLAALGFTVLRNVLTNNIEQALAVFDGVAASRAGLDFWIDGVVFKIDNLGLQKTLGITDNRPKGQMVMKFEAEGEITTLERVELTVGHIGAIIPTGKITPVRIGGTTVSSVLLNNFDEIEALGLAVGDDVKVIKAKDIIPKIVAVVSRPKGRQPIPVPTTCPVCGGAAGRRVNIAKGDKAGEEGAVIECKNSGCAARSTARLKTWITKLDIQGIGDEVLSALIEKMGIKTPADLYRLASDTAKMQTFPQLIVGAGKLGIKRAEAIVRQIRDKKTMPLNVFLGSLGIPMLGRRRAELVMEAAPGVFDQLEDWIYPEKLLAMADKIGIKNMVHAIVNGIAAFRDEIDDLVQYVTFVGPTGNLGPSEDLPPENDELVTEGDGPFDGYVICFTGKIEKTDEGGKRYTRDRMQKLVVEGGGKVSDDVRAGVTHLVQASKDSVSSKSAKAKKLGVALMSEADFFAMLGL